MKDLSKGNVRFLSFDTTHQLNWMDMYVGVFVTENMHGDTEVLAYSVQVIHTLVICMVVASVMGTDSSHGHSSSSLSQGSSSSDKSR